MEKTEDFKCTFQNDGGSPICGKKAIYIVKNIGIGKTYPFIQGFQGLSCERHKDMGLEYKVYDIVLEFKPI